MAHPKPIVEQRARGRARPEELIMIERDEELSQSVDDFLDPEFVREEELRLARGAALEAAARTAGCSVVWARGRGVDGDVRLMPDHEAGEGDWMPMREAFQRLIGI